MSEDELKSKLIKRQILAIGLGCCFGWGLTYLDTEVFHDYASGLFLLMPFVMAVSVTIICGYKGNVSRINLRNACYWTLLIYCIGIVAYAWEGIICIAMASPLAILFTWLGYKTGLFILKKLKNIYQTTTLSFLILLVPGTMGVQKNLFDQMPKIRSVVTSVEINASKEKKWQNLTAVSEINEPTCFIFKIGIAKPLSATLSKGGLGATRYCNFTTGTAVEKISIWNEPNILRFDILSQPEPMKELSFYDIHPNHLRGYLVSKVGEFKLTSLSNGHTLLQGTSWYYNRISPGIYWNLWSDYIIHKIHMQVME